MIGGRAQGSTRRFAPTVAGAVAVLVALVAVPSSSSASVSPRATVVASVMDSVSCTPGQCVAAGELSSLKAMQVWTLTHGQWGVLSLPPRGLIVSMSCPQLSSCVGVGYAEVGVGGNYVGFAEQLTAGVWRQLPLPSSTPRLESVSCVSSTWCMAVGATTMEPTSGAALVWNGTAWTHVSTATVSPSSGLWAVSCLSSTLCMAAGYSDAQPLAESWDGTSFTVTTPPPNPPVEGGSGLDAISCTSAGFCLAVGISTGCCGSTGGLAMAWNGSSWSNVTMSTALYAAALTGVSCATSTSCLAVGTTSPADTQSFLPYADVGIWGGSSLTAVRDALVGKQSALGAVSCTRANWCAAVGSFTTRGGVVQPLVERWDGVTLNRMFVPG
jgi:hypothetical protein